jgi:hypothetical protein
VVVAASRYRRELRSRASATPPAPGNAPTRIRDLPLDHVRAVRCDDAAQLGPGKISTMLGQKPRGAEPAATITAVAGDGDHVEDPGGDLGEGDGACQLKPVAFVFGAAWCRAIGVA